MAKAVSGGSSSVAGAKTVKTKTTKAKATTCKTTKAVVAKATKVGKVAAAKTDYKNPSSDRKVMPVSPLLLASVGVLAVGYMLYEYRYDLANKIAQFRRNRTIRRGASSTFARR